MSDPGEHRGKVLRQIGAIGQIARDQVVERSGGLDRAGRQASPFRSRCVERSPAGCGKRPDYRARLVIDNLARPS
jgi:hypothetical protein